MNRLSPRAHGAALGMLLVFFLAFGHPSPQGDKKMQGIWLVRNEQYNALRPTIMDVRAGAVKPLPLAAAKGAAGYPCPYSNSLRNSRVPLPLPTGSWTVRWCADWDPYHPPVFVLQQEDRALVHAVPWRLFDSEGKLLATGEPKGNAVLLDSVHGFFYTLLSSGYLAGSRLTDGQQAFLYLPSYGDSISRTLLARRADRILMTGYQLERDPDGGHKPNRSIIEGLDLPGSVRTDSLGLLTSGVSIGRLEISSSHLVSAMDDRRIVVALPDRVYVVDWDLKVQRALAGSFTPLLLSLDEDGRMYAIVESDKRVQLWLLTENGERAYNLVLPAGTEKITTPPVVTYDHTVYLLTAQQILSVAPDGKLNWMKTAQGSIAGAIVTADGQLVVSEGSSIVAWNAQGQRRDLCTFPGEQLMTPPVLTQAGELLVAARSRLFCLKRTAARERGKP
jgi:hypothetical protein